MARIPSYPRRQYTRLLSTWAHRNSRVVTLATLGGLAVVALSTLLTIYALPRGPITWWGLGVLHAVTVGTFLHFFTLAFLTHDPAGIRQLRGAWGEENTRDELRRAERKGLIWGRVDSISLQCGDLDHLVVTKNGGLLAIDSKWRYDVDDREQMAAAARRVQIRAEGVMRSLLAPDTSGRRRARTNPVPVTPVIVLWGAAQHELPDDARVGDIHFVAGRSLVSWLADLNGRPVDKRAAAHLLERLTHFRSSTSAHARAPLGAPVSRRSPPFSTRA